MNVYGHVSEHSVYIPSLDMYIHLFGDHHSDEYNNKCNKKSMFVGKMIEQYLLKKYTDDEPIDLFIECDPRIEDKRRKVKGGMGGGNPPSILSMVSDMYKDCGTGNKKCKYNQDSVNVHFCDIRNIKDARQIALEFCKSIPDRHISKKLKEEYTDAVNNIKDIYLNTTGNTREIRNTIKFETDVHLFDFFTLCCMFAFKSKRVIGYFGFIHAKNIFRILKRCFKGDIKVLNNYSIDRMKHPNKCHTMGGLFTLT